MTAYAVPDESVGALLAVMLRDALAVDESLRLRLFVNDIIPQRSATVASFTEATFTGYSERIIDRADWGTPVVGDDHLARIRPTLAPYTWTPTGGLQTVYGYFICNAAADRVRFVKRFSEPRVLAAGVPLSLIPVITLASASYG